MVRLPQTIAYPVSWALFDRNGELLESRKVQTELYDELVDSKTGREVETLRTREINFYTGCL